MVTVATMLPMMIGLVVIQRLSELWIAKRNETKLLDMGAVEFGRDHYPLFFLLHGGWFVGWIAEALVRGPNLAGSWPLWLTAFAVAQILRYWAIASLGHRWNTRILVIPGLAPVSRGPYRFLGHPNYVAVGIELLSVPMMFGSVITAIVASGLNLLLLLGIRIPAENRALRLPGGQL